VAAEAKEAEAAEEGEKDASEALMELAGLAAAGRPVDHMFGKQREIRGAWCGFDAANAVQYMARAGTQIAIAVKECAVNSNSRRDAGHAPFGELALAPCAADIEAAISSLLWVATWISLAVTQCAERANVEALCAGVIEALFAAVVDLTAAGTVMTETCRLPPTAPDREAPFPIRRLQEEPLAGNPAYTERNAVYDAKTALTPEEAQLEEAMCVQDAIMAATSLGQYGVAVDQTIFACPLEHLNVYTQEVCVIDISYMLNRMFQTMTFVGAAISHCGRAIGARLGAECFAASMQVTASVAGVPLVAAGIDLSCPGTEHYLGDEFGDLAVKVVEVAAVGRRLEEAARNATAMVAATRPLVV